MKDNYQNNLRPRYPTSYVVADSRSSRSLCSRAIRTVCMASSILSVSPRSHNSKNDLASELEDICPAHISRAIRKQKTVHTDRNKNEWSAVQWAALPTHIHGFLPGRVIQPWVTTRLHQGPNCIDFPREARSVQGCPVESAAHIDIGAPGQ